MVGLWTIRHWDQVHSHWVQFTLVCRGYDNHNCHNKPHIVNGIGVRMTSCPEAMVLRTWRFWKRVSRNLTMGHVGRQLGCLPLTQTVKVGAQPWQCKQSFLNVYGRIIDQVKDCSLLLVSYKSIPWCSEVGVRPWWWEVGSDNDVEKFSSHLNEVEKLGSDSAVWILRLDHGRR